MTVNTSGYKASVEVYDPRERRYLPSTRGSVSHDGGGIADSRQMAAVTMGQEDGAFVSSLVVPAGPGGALRRMSSTGECRGIRSGQWAAHCAVMETGLQFDHRRQAGRELQL